jgi:PHD/YefM family antitoxin component YafN of YafNO toxin-antitoxin module
LNLRPNTWEEQLKKAIAIGDTPKNDVSETSYLLSSPANAKKLLLSLKQYKARKR